MKYKLPISIIIISLFASLASSAPKGAKRLSDLDQDNNGQINFEEFSKTQLERFSNLDKNSDGIISQDEFLMPVSNHFKKLEQLEWIIDQDIPIPDVINNTRMPFKQWKKVCLYFYENSYGIDLVAVNPKPPLSVLSCLAVLNPVTLSELICVLDFDTLFTLSV